MKKSYIFLILIFFSCTSFSQDRQVRNVGPFDAIKAGGSFETYIKKGGSEKVVIEADSGPIDKIITEVNHGTLNIYIENDSWKNYSFRNVKVYVTFVDVDEVHGSGSGNTYLESPIDAKYLVISSSGSGNMYCTDRLTSSSDAKINNSGSGNLKIEGSVKVNGEVSINNSGSGNMKIQQLTSHQNFINNSGSGDLDIDGGETGYQKIVMSGSGNVKMGGLQSDECDISKSGSGTVYLNVREELTGNSSGSGNIYLTKSTAKLDIRTSGSGKIKTLN